MDPSLVNGAGRASGVSWSTVRWVRWWRRGVDLCWSVWGEPAELVWTAHGPGALGREALAGSRDVAVRPRVDVATAGGRDVGFLMPQADRDLAERLSGGRGQSCDLVGGGGLRASGPSCPVDQERDQPRGGAVLRRSPVGNRGPHGPEHEPQVVAVKIVAGTCLPQPLGQGVDDVACLGPDRVVGGDRHA